MHSSFKIIKKIVPALLLLSFLPAAQAQDAAIRQFLTLPQMKGASCSFMVEDTGSEETLCSHDAGRQLTPASVLKLVTTATALEVLGEDFRYATKLEYDGSITNGVLDGNLYIRGSGDPTLGSSHFAADRSRYTPDQNSFIPQWLAAIKKAGIKKITGAVIADDSLFDTEGVSPKWVFEDMGNYYGAGCYAISVFDNIYRLYVTSAGAGSKPAIVGTVPPMPALRFHNYLRAAPVRTDSSYILGAPFSAERFLYGIVPTNKDRFALRGDLPDPALFLAEYTTEKLLAAGIETIGTPASYRILAEENKWKPGERKTLATTYSPTLGDITRIVNERSHNLFAEALLRTLGLKYKPKPGETLSSAAKGVKMVEAHWKAKGFDPAGLWMYDGSGLALANKTTAAFLCKLLTYMDKHSKQSAAFRASLPRAGQEGSVASFLKGTPLEGAASLKSGGMSRVRCYAGYINKEGKRYAIAILVNNYNCEARVITKDIERLLLALP